MSDEPVGVDDKIAVLHLSFDRETLDLQMSGTQIPIDFAISMLDRAKRLLETQERIAVAAGLAAQAEQRQNGVARTASVLSRIRN